MSLTTPAVADVRDNILAQLETSLGQAVPLLPKSFLRVLAAACAGVFILLYKFAGFSFLQMFVQTASFGDTVVNGVTLNPLLFWGRLIGVGDRIAATQAQLAITVTVVNQSGTLDAGTQLLGPGNGYTYSVLAAVALNAPTVVATVQAVADQVGAGGAGAGGNLNSGDTLSFANPLANVTRNAVVASVLVVAADAEEVDAYRKRVVGRFQKRPQGGAYADYQEWALDAAGIVNVYPYSGASPGQVDIYCEALVTTGAPSGIPSSPQLTAVLNLINYDLDGRATRRPANAFVNVYAITRTLLDVTVAGIAGVGDLATVRADIQTAVTNFLYSLEPYILGLSVPPRVDVVTQTRLTSIAEDIVSAAGGTFTGATFVLHSGGGALSVYSLTTGEKVRLNAIAFT